jgi:hypothetical protein
MMKRLFLSGLSLLLAWSALAAPQQQVQIATVKTTAVASGGAVAAPTLTGSPILLASWDFGDNAKITQASNLISAISGSDGTSVTLTQGTGSAQPTLITAGGYGAAQFNAAQSLKAASSLGLAASGTVTVVAIAEMAEPATNGTFLSFSSSNSNTSSYGRHKMTANGTYLGFGMRVGDNSTNQLASMGNSSGGNAYPRGRHLIVGAGAANAGTVSIYKDAAANVGTVTSQFTSVSGGYVAVTMGVDQVADFLDGLVWRMLIYQGTLSTTNVTELAAWANANWGIGVDAATLNKADLSWDIRDTAGITGYKACWSQTYGACTFSASISGASTQTYQVTGLGTGTWYFSLRSVNANGEGDSIPMGQKAIR